MTGKPRPPLSPGEIRAYPVLPLRDIVVFPHMIVPLFVGREKSIRALEEVMRNDTFILLATQKNASDDDPSTNAIYEVGTLASVPIEKIASVAGSSSEAFVCVASRMNVSERITSSSALIDFSRPTNSGTIICGKTTMSRSGRTG